MASAGESRKSLLYEEGLKLQAEAEQEEQKDSSKALALFEKAVDHFLSSVKFEADTEETKERRRERVLLCWEKAHELRKLVKVEDNDQKDGSSHDATKERKRRISRNFTVDNPHVSWDTLAGLEEAKKKLKEDVVLPMKFPHLFEGARSVSHEGVLIFGCPGSGKTLLSRALATELKDSTFISISTADLISKYRVETDMTIQALFSVARDSQPSVIFIDDVDAFFDADYATLDRQGEFLREMEADNDGVLVVVSSSSPWVIKPNFRRKFQKLVYVGLPDEDAREKIFRQNLAEMGTSLTDEDYHEMARRTEGYSGSDIVVIIKDALMEPVRKVQAATHYKKVAGPSPKDDSVIVDDLLMPCSPDDPEATEMHYMDIPEDKIYLPPVSMTDVERCMLRTRPSVDKLEIEKLLKFKDECECG